MSKSTISTFQLFEMFPTPESARLERPTNPVSPEKRISRSRSRAKKLTRVTTKSASAASRLLLKPMRTEWCSQFCTALAQKSRKESCMERSLVLAQQIIASLEFNHIDFSAHRLTAERVVQTHVEALLKEGRNEDRKIDRNTQPGE